MFLWIHRSEAASRIKAAPKHNRATSWFNAGVLFLESFIFVNRERRADVTSQIAPVLTHRSKGTVSRKDCGLSTCILANSSLAFFCVFFFCVYSFKSGILPGLPFRRTLKNGVIRNSSTYSTIFLWQPCPRRLSTVPWTLNLLVIEADGLVAFSYYHACLLFSFWSPKTTLLLCFLCLHVQSGAHSTGTTVTFLHLNTLNDGYKD